MGYEMTLFPLGPVYPCRAAMCAALRPACPRRPGRAPARSVPDRSYGCCCWATPRPRASVRRRRRKRFAAV